VYSSCIFCSSALGQNEAIEAFPVGRRVAFDSAKGRLWVVCPRCARWNLSPFESRWEAIESAERLFRDTPTRVSTEHVGLAKLQEGTELVRVGAPLLPEFAAWRYGGELLKRHTRAMKRTIIDNSLGLSATALVGAGAWWQLRGGSMSGLALVPTALPLLHMGYSWRLHRDLTATKIHLRSDDGTLLPLAFSAALNARLLIANGEWSLRVEHRIAAERGPIRRALRMKPGIVPFHWRYRTLHGAAAHRALATMLPAINRDGGNQPAVDMAVALITQHPQLAETMVEVLQQRTAPAQRGDTRELLSLDGPFRLALEMSLHEGDERRALDGELHELETRWREADEIAGIADGLLLPDDLSERVARLRRPGA
jgi:hypothetical protein